MEINLFPKRTQFHIIIGKILVEAFRFGVRNSHLYCRVARRLAFSDGLGLPPKASRAFLLWVEPRVEPRLKIRNQGWA